ncbi:MAG: hypothetical protein KDA58_04830 [Planctomycetaceae bacterium]|nr:hypothetical protein [Planctomycetaceae bacterium]
MARAEGDRLHLGFMHVAQTDAGFVGGLLVTNRQGRPLEFQCTTPLRPNNTQQMLYGPTLRPYIFADLLGKTLFDRVAVKPDLIVVQQPELLDLRPLIAAPVGCIAEPTEGDLPDETRIQLGGQHLRIHAEAHEDRDALHAASSLIPNDADLAEPLDRVRDALQETVRAGAVA